LEILVWYLLARSLAEVVGRVFSPQMYVKRYAKGFTTKRRVIEIAHSIAIAIVLILVLKG